MKVLFLQDNGINESLAISDISALLKSRGHTTDLLIMRNEGHFQQRIAESNPGLVVVPMDIWGEHVALSIASTAKKAVDAPIVFCGTYPMLFPEIVEHPEVDIVVQGESEFPILDLADHLQDSASIDAIPNVSVKHDGKVIRNEMRPLLQDLTELPLPDRALYFKYRFIRQMSLKRFTSGRGCHNACSFCYNATFMASYRGKGKYIRRKPVSRMIEEIDEMRRMAPLKSVHFSDDIFTYDKNWVLDFCHQYSRRFPRVPFTCNTTVHDIDEEMVTAMKRACCFGIAIGVETGNETLRMKKLNKPYRDSDIVRTSALIKKHGLFLTTFNMMALPYETIENTFETIRFNRQIKSDNTRYTFLSPVPRTALVESAISDGLLEHDSGKAGREILAPKLQSKINRQFESLYALADIAALSPRMEKLVAKWIDRKIPRIVLILLLFPRIYREKKFLNIGLISGFIYFLHTSMPQHRTKNFNNYLP